MKLAFGSDHAGYELRKYLAKAVAESGNEVVEVGAQSPDPYDYPDAADLLVPMILEGVADLGVLVCGSGIGISIRANRHPGIRAAVCCGPEMAKLAREHNYANVLCLGARLIKEELALETLEAFLETQPDSAERHARRVAKLDSTI